MPSIKGTLYLSSILKCNCLKIAVVHRKIICTCMPVSSKYAFIKGSKCRPHIVSLSIHSSTDSYHPLICQTKSKNALRKDLVSSSWASWLGA